MGDVASIGLLGSAQSNSYLLVGTGVISVHVSGFSRWFAFSEVSDINRWVIDLVGRMPFPRRGLSHRSTLQMYIR